LFEYDAASPLQPVSTLVEEHVEGHLHDLSYRVTESSDCAHAWVIVPSRPDSLPYVVYLHGGGQDRGAFLSEALLLADLGIASLLIDLPQARASRIFHARITTKRCFFRLSLL
jgi:hypothetical protein